MRVVDARIHGAGGVPVTRRDAIRWIRGWEAAYGRQWGAAAIHAALDTCAAPSDAQVRNAVILLAATVSSPPPRSMVDRLVSYGAARGIAAAPSAAQVALGAMRRGTKCWSEGVVLDSLESYWEAVEAAEDGV